MAKISMGAAAAHSWRHRRAVGGAGLPQIEPLLKAHHRHHPKVDAGLLQHAYLVAADLHAGQVRKSGEPYITHPFAVAVLLAEMGMDTSTLAAALLHDTVEDTSYVLGQLRAEFGDEIAELVDGVTKLDGSKWGDRAEGETFRKMILASAGDLRVLLIKLADRLHNLRTLQYHPEREKRERIARASLQLLVPFAERLGVHVLKREMEDLCFEVLQPGEFEATRSAVSEAEPLHADYMTRAAAQLDQALAAGELKATTVVRRRHLYSIYRDRSGDLRELRPGDTHRMVVVVDGDDNGCYVAVGAVHGLWRPLAGRFKDYIAVPKYNLYRSLHTEVIGPDGHVLELFIRTAAQHRVSEYGLAAHVADAASAADRAKVTRRPDLEWLRRLLAWQSEARSADYLDSLRIDLKPGSILTFTPAGQAIPLPRGATPVDFAYALGPDAGNTCIGAMVDGRLVSLSAPLKDGNVVEILASESGGPDAGWLDFARTAQARVQISQWLAERKTEQAAAAGRGMLADDTKARGLELLDAETSGTVIAVARGRGYRDLDALYAAIASGRADPGTIASEIVTQMTGPAGSNG